MEQLTRRPFVATDIGSVGLTAAGLAFSNSPAADKPNIIFLLRYYDTTGKQILAKPITWQESRYSGNSSFNCAAVLMN